MTFSFLSNFDDIRHLPEDTHQRANLLTTTSQFTVSYILFLVMQSRIAIASEVS